MAIPLHTQFLNTHEDGIIHNILVPSKSVAPFYFFFHLSLRYYGGYTRQTTIVPPAAAVANVAVVFVIVLIAAADVVVVVKLQLVPLATAFCSTILIILYLSILLCHLLLFLSVFLLPLVSISVLRFQCPIE